MAEIQDRRRGETSLFSLIQKIHELEEKFPYYLKTYQKNYQTHFFSNMMTCFALTILHAIKTRYILLSIIILFVRVSHWEYIIGIIIYIVVDIFVTFIMANFGFWYVFRWCCEKRGKKHSMPHFFDPFEFVLNIENLYEKVEYKIFQAIVLVLVLFGCVFISVYSYFDKSGALNEVTCHYTDIIPSGSDVSNMTQMTQEMVVFAIPFLSVLNVLPSNTKYYTGCQVDQSFLWFEFYKGVIIGLLNFVLLMISILYYDGPSCDRYIRQLQTFKENGIPFPHIKISWYKIFSRSSKTIIKDIVDGLYYIKEFDKQNRAIDPYRRFSYEEMGRSETISHLDLSYFEDLTSFEIGLLEYFFIDFKKRKKDTIFLGYPSTDWKNKFEKGYNCTRCKEKSPAQTPFYYCEKCKILDNYDKIVCLNCKKLRNHKHGFQLYSGIPATGFHDECSKCKRSIEYPYSQLFYSEEEKATWCMNCYLNVSTARIRELLGSFIFFDKKLEKSQMIKYRNELPHPDLERGFECEVCFKDYSNGFPFFFDRKKDISANVPEVKIDKQLTEEEEEKVEEHVDVEMGEEAKKKIKCICVNCFREKIIKCEKERDYNSKYALLVAYELQFGIPKKGIEYYKMKKNISCAVCSKIEHTDFFYNSQTERVQCVDCFERDEVKDKNEIYVDTTADLDDEKFNAYTYGESTRTLSKAFTRKILSKVYKPKILKFFKNKNGVFLFQNQIENVLGILFFCFVFVPTNLIHVFLCNQYVDSLVLGLSYLFFGLIYFPASLIFCCYRPKNLLDNHEEFSWDALFILEEKNRVVFWMLIVGLCLIFPNSWFMFIGIFFIIYFQQNILSLNKADSILYSCFCFPCLLVTSMFKCCGQFCYIIVYLLFFFIAVVVYLLIFVFGLWVVNESIFNSFKFFWKTTFVDGKPVTMNLLDNGWYLPLKGVGWNKPMYFFRGGTALFVLFFAFFVYILVYFCFRFYFRKPIRDFTSYKQFLKSISQEEKKEEKEEKGKKVKGKVHSFILNPNLFFFEIKRRFFKRMCLLLFGLVIFFFVIGVISPVFWLVLFLSVVGLPFYLMVSCLLTRRGYFRKKELPKVSTFFETVNEIKESIKVLNKNELASVGKLSKFYKQKDVYLEEEKRLKQLEVRKKVEIFFFLNFLMKSSKSFLKYFPRKEEIKGDSEEATSLVNVKNDFELELNKLQVDQFELGKKVCRDVFAVFRLRNVKYIELFHSSLSRRERSAKRKKKITQYKASLVREVVPISKNVISKGWKSHVLTYKKQDWIENLKNYNNDQFIDKSFEMFGIQFDFLIHKKWGVTGDRAWFLFPRVPFPDLAKCEVKVKIPEFEFDYYLPPFLFYNGLGWGCDSYKFDPSTKDFTCTIEVKINDLINRKEFVDLSNKYKKHLSGIKEGDTDNTIVKIGGKGKKHQWTSNIFYLHDLPHIIHFYPNERSKETKGKTSMGIYLLDYPNFYLVDADYEVEVRYDDEQDNKCSSHKGKIKPNAEYMIDGIFPINHEYDRDYRVNITMKYKKFFEKGGKHKM